MKSHRITCNHHIADVNEDGSWTAGAAALINTAHQLARQAKVGEDLL